MSYPWDCYYKYLTIEWHYRKGDGHNYVCKTSFDDNPLVTEENAEVWQEYLSKLLKNAVTKEALESEEFKQIILKCRERKEREERWAKRAEEIRERDRYRRQLRRLNPLGFIPDGLKADYEKEYTYFVRSAVDWTPKDADDFLFQCRSFERFACKSLPKMLEAQRPDASYAMTLTLCRHLPLWLARKDLADYFYDYKSRIKKLILSAYESLVKSAIAWNNEEKRQEVCKVIEDDASQYELWGLKPKQLLALRPLTPINGTPIQIERKPNKDELYEIERARRRAEQEARRKEEEEREKHSLIPLNQFFERTIFTRSNVDWECMTIGRMINTLGSEVKKYINKGQTHDALLLFLQIVKSMCRHFVIDEHYNFFDDMYDPEYSCMRIVDDLNEAYAKHKLSPSDIDFFHQAWKEIEQMEACKEYGLGNFKFRF